MKKISSGHKPQLPAVYYAFIFIIVMVPLVFWKGLGNNFDLIKSAVLYITCGLFFIILAREITSVKNSKNIIHVIILEKKQDLLISLLILILILSVIFSLNPVVSINGTYDRQFGLMTYLVIFILYFLTSPVLSEKKSLHSVLFIMELTAVIIAGYVIICFSGFDIFGLRPQQFSRPFSPTGHPVFTAGILTLLFPFSVLNITKKKSKSIKFLFPVIIISGIFFTQTRAAYVAAAAEIILLLLFYPAFIKNRKVFFRKNFKKIIPVAAVILLLAIIFFLLFPDNIFVRRIYSITTLTEQPRWYLWKDSLRMLMNFPLTGTGIAQFSNGFESFAGYELKFAEVKSTFDNPHNNIINIMCTTGIMGGVIYLLLIVYLVSDAIKNFRNKDKTISNFYLAVISCVIGYFIYGLADFDDISVFLYFIIINAAYKHFKYNCNKESPVFVYFKFKKPYNYFVSALMLLFSFFIIYTAYLKVSAEFIYTSAINYYSQGNYISFDEKMQNALSLQPEQSFYRYNYAFYIFDNVTRHPELPAEKKFIEFNKAKDELKKCLKNYSSKNECLAMLSFLELEQGNKQEADSIIAGVFKTDTCQFRYRNNLARYYLKNGNDSMALYELNILLKWNPKSTEVLSTYVLYLESNKRYKEAAEVCKTILDILPNDSFASEQIKKLYPIIRK